MAPRLVWIMAPGLDPDGVVSRLDTLPSLAVLLQHGSMGFLELGGPAEADIAEWMLLTQRPVEALPWRPGLRLPRPDPIAMRILSRHPGAAVVTLGQGDSRLPGHFDVPEGPSPVHEISRVVDRVAEAVDTDPDLLVVQLPAAAHALHGVADMAALFDAAMRAMLTVLGEHSHVLVSSPLAFRPCQRLLCLSEVLTGESIAGMRVGADFGLIELADPSAADRVEARLFDLRTSEGVGLVADVRRFAGQAHVLEVRPVAGCGLTADPVEQGDHVLCDYGALILAGPGVARGALPSVRLEHLLAGVDALMRGAPEEGPLSPWFRVADEEAVDLSQHLYGARACGGSYP